MNRRLPFQDEHLVQRWARLAAQCHYRLDELARHCHITTRQLQRLMHSTFGLTPEDWMRRQRMAAAQYLLTEQMSVKSVARWLGYRRESHFNRHFKASFGMTPTQFINSWQIRNNRSLFN
jgi:AraC family chemosensory pili system transcriptional regulator ChpD